MELTERTIGGFLEYWAEKTPDKEYIVYSDRDLRFTYKAFDSTCAQHGQRMMPSVSKGTHWVLGDQMSLIG